jgi:monothiol glutaredoxin
LTKIKTTGLEQIGIALITLCFLFCAERVEYRDLRRKWMMTMETIDKIKQQIAENNILLYMKGSPKLPSCGFSSQASQALMSCGEKFAYVDILQNPDIRAELPKYAQWPTFPQLWIDGELIGGCDIILEMFQKGELQPLIKDAAAKSGE